MNLKKSLTLVTAIMMLFGMFLAARPAVAGDSPPPPSPILIVKKTAEGSSNIAWNWTIDKVGDQTELTLSPGQSHLVNYQVTVTASPAGDSTWTVTGNIGFINNSSSEVVIASVEDVLSDGTTATVTCPFDFPLTLPAGWAPPGGGCSYTASGSGPMPTSNTATVYLEGGVVGGSDTVPVSTVGSSQTDECVDVSDDQYGFLGTVCAGDAPKTFSYSMFVGPYEVCGMYEFTNIASFVTNDTGSTGSDSWTVFINVPCEGGCTLTPGYWKTHSKYGPAPYDSLWGSNGEFDEDTTFYLSGKTYYQVLWTPPQGNAYYILAHAFIAARLNVLNGAAATPSVEAALSWADMFFNVFSPNTKLSKEMRNTVLMYADLLDNYNNGLIGPGHCSE